jgi:hypothetical protein
VLAASILRKRIRRFGGAANKKAAGLDPNRDDIRKCLPRRLRSSQRNERERCLTVVRCPGAIELRR